MVIQKYPVLNYKKGRTDELGRKYKPEIIVLHIGEGTFGDIKRKHIKPTKNIFGQILSTFIHEEKSSHYCIKFNGDIAQFVNEEDTAWANGVVDKPTNKIVLSRNVNPNLFSISIEHEGSSRVDIEEAQYHATVELVKDICSRWNIPIDREHIIKHQEIRISKTCPGKIDVDKIIRLASQSVPIQPDIPTPIICDPKIIEEQKGLIAQLLSFISNYLKK